MSMSCSDHEWITESLGVLMRAIKELEDKVIALEGRCSALHQETLAVKNRNGLK